jgi:hypothetical protein
MIEYEQQDYDTAKEIITKGFLMDLNKQTLDLTETNIIDIAKKYYILRLRTFNPDTGEHL